MKKKILNVVGSSRRFIAQNREDYISLTDITKHKATDRTDHVIQNWMRNRDIIEYLGLWEKLHNPSFKPIEFEGFKKQAGLNSFSLTPQRWVAKTSAIGIFSKRGRYGGTYAHKDIAFEFASWISPEFKLYLIKEFQRLKEEEQKQQSLEWNVSRALTKINYKIHTDAIEKHLIPAKISLNELSNIYAREADVLNKALFGKTAQEWCKEHPTKEGNIRDYATVTQLVCLANLESLNAEFIRQGVGQKERLVRLNEIAIIQMTSLVSNMSVKKLEEGGGRS